MTTTGHYHPTRGIDFAEWRRVRAQRRRQRLELQSLAELGDHLRADIGLPPARRIRPPSLLTPRL